MDIFDNLDLAESKLIVLYTFHKLNFPITNNQLTNIMIENNFMNYFSLQQYLAELVNSKYIKIKNEDGKHFYTITQDGENILNYFINRVPFIAKEKIQNVIKSNFDRIKEEIQITSDYYPESETQYIVQCKVNEGSINLIDIKVNVPTKNIAKNICDHWRSHASTIFSEIFESLNKSRD